MGHGRGGRRAHPACNDADGALSTAGFAAATDRLFATLDPKGDGVVTPARIRGLIPLPSARAFLPMRKMPA